MTDRSENDSQSNFSPYSRELTETVSIELVPVAGGTFLMGSPASEAGRSEDEGPQQQVSVDSFWMGKYEVTWDQYELFSEYVLNDLDEDIASAAGKVEISSDAISIPTPPYVDMSFGMGKSGYPAISMTHYAAVMFTKWLTAKTGEFYRLPTEAEWEYACRAGSESAYYYGEHSDELDQYAWHDQNSDRSYNRVGTKTPNAFGLHDMAGNIAEWTMDQYHEDYYDRLSADGAENPWFRPTELYPRSVRGGSWRDSEEEQRCAMRRGSLKRWKQLDPQMPKSLWWHTNAPFLGFRIVRPLEAPPEEEIQQYWIEAMNDY